jgi:hypothetical protein
MRFFSRAEWGAVAPRGNWTQVDRADGVKVHYEGTHVPPELAHDDQHGQCAGRVRAIQASHMADDDQKWIDIAYSAMVCPHGFVFEGRGVHHLNGANGNGALNRGHYAVCAMVGDSGLIEPTEAMLHGLRDAIEWLQRDGGAGPEVKGHKDGYATSCPGAALYTWVLAGAPRPGGTQAPPVPPVPVPAAPRFPGRLLRVASPMLHGDDVRDWQQRMAQRGWPIGVDGWFGPASARIARLFQLEKMIGADGIVGPETWAAAFRTDNIT